MNAAPRIEWLGHAAVTVTFADGTRVLFDPYEPGGFDGRIAHAPIRGPFDIVVLTHHHADHAFVTPALGDPVVVDRPCRVGRLRFRMVPAWHDRVEGATMGLVRLAALEGDGHRIVHLGDVGVPPSPTQVRRLGRPAILFVPVGGTFTLAAAAAAEAVARLRPALVVPLHYRTARCTLPLDDEAPFVALARERGWPVAAAPSPVALEAPSPGPPRILLLAPTL